MCQFVVGAGVDEAVGQAAVDAVTPAPLDVALQVFEELRARRADVDRLRRAQVERAREEAELAQRRYMILPAAMASEIFVFPCTQHIQYFTPGVVAPRLPLAVHVPILWLC